MKKLLIGFIVCSFSIAYVHAQTEKKAKESKILFTSYIGFASATGNIKSNVGNGFLAMTGIELKLSKTTSLVGELNFDSYKYEVKNSSYNLQGTVNTIPLTISYKKYFSTKKVSPYIKLGAGIANVSKPFVEQENNFTSIKNETNFCFQYQSSSGLCYQFKKDYILFFEAGFQQYQSRLILNNNLNTVSLKIGISTAM